MSITRLTDAPPLFLTEDELAILTGRKMKSKQIEALREMGIPFFVNALGRPIVARSAVEGSAGRPARAPDKPWVPKVLRDKDIS